MTGENGNDGAEPRAVPEPVLVETGKGLTVQYGNRLLYSRYDPSRNPDATAASAAIRAETLVICPSPALGYGLGALLEKLPDGCLVLAIESDEVLMAMSIKRIPEAILSHPRFRFARTASPSRLLEYIDGLGLPPFRRCMRLDLSGGAALDPVFYGEVIRLTDEYIQRYWRNRLTLMKLGRNYARNFFRNLPHAGRSIPLLPGMAGKTVIVAGAGPSLDETLSFIAANRRRLFVLAVDTALAPLADFGIRPDAVIVVESQFWIERAFAGSKDSLTPVFADLTARPAAIRATGGEATFFLSEYDRLSYIKRFLHAGVPVTVIPPLGSVGLVALHIASIIAPANFPVLVTGLDFSFARGMTHSRGAPPSRESRRASNRLAPALSSTPSLADGTFSMKGKSGETVFSDPALSGYAQLCAYLFPGSRAGGMFDIGSSGLDTGIPRLSPDEANTRLDEAGPVQQSRAAEPMDASKKVRAFLEDEKKRLLLIRGILTGEMTEEGALEKAVREADYLFAHFPDGFRGYSGDTGFLKRVRIELEYFLKTLNIALEE